MKKVYSILGIVALVILGLDQWTKHWALETLVKEGNSRPVLSWWSWTMVHNYAAAFGSFSKVPFITSESSRVLFLLLVPIVVLGLLWFFHIKHITKKEIFRPTVMGLVVGGAIGNVIDRLRFGYVIDFIDWFYPSTSGKCLPLFFLGSEGKSCHWPVFNVADAAISIALVLLLLEPFILKNLPKEKS